MLDFVKLGYNYIELKNFKIKIINFKKINIKNYVL